MSKIHKIIRLINLLHFRKSISIEEIEEICEVSRRGAYRYLNTISEANVPLWFDNELQRYVVDHERSFDIPDFNLNDAGLLTFALWLLAGKLGSHYTEDIVTLNNRLLTRLTSSSNSLWGILEKSSEDASDYVQKDHAALYHTILVHLAIATGSSLEVHVHNGSGAGRGLLIKNPILVFRNEWLVVDSLSEGQSAIPLSRIEKVSVRCTMKSQRQTHLQHNLDAMAGL
jgi:predicted DNA-binding transcriptional regulator YafY